MGRIGVDIYPQSDGPLESVTAFARSLGGTATNVAVAAARLGRRTAVITKVGDDPFGRYIRGALKEFGVDARFVGTDPQLRTPLAFCEIHPPDDFPLLFYREPSAPDLQLRADELDFDTVREAGIFWVTGPGLSVQPSRSTTLEALTWRDGERIVDLDWRPMFWTEDPTPLMRAAVERATVADATRPHTRAGVAGGPGAAGTAEAAGVAGGEAEPLEMARRLLELGPRLAI